jgi:hypothetical protein
MADTCHHGNEGVGELSMTPPQRRPQIRDHADRWFSWIFFASKLYDNRLDFVEQFNMNHYIKHILGHKHLCGTS